MADNQINITVTAKDNASKAFKGISGSIEGIGETARKGVQQLTTLTAALGAAAIGVAGYGIKIAADMETARQGFIGLGISAEDTEKTMERLKKEAAATPFELPGLTTATQLLTAVTKDGDKSIDILLDVGKSLAAVGKGQAELDRIIVNLQQISATGRAAMIDIKQFAFAGIPIFELLTEKTGLTGEALEDLITEGGVTFELLTEMFAEAGGEVSNLNELLAEASGYTDIMARLGTSNIERFQTAWDNAGGSVEDFTKLLQEDYANGLGDLNTILEDTGLTIDELADAFANQEMKAGRFATAFTSQAGTFNQLVSNMKDNLGIFFSELVTKSGIFDKVKELLKQFNEWLEANREELIRIAGIVMDKVVGAIETLFEWIGKGIEFLGELKDALFSNDEEFMQFAETVGIITGLVIALGIAFGVLTSPIFLVVAAIAAVAFVMTKLGITVEDVWNFIVTIFNTAVGIITIVVETAFNLVWNIIQNVMESIRNVIEGVWNIIQGVWNIFTGLITGDTEKFNEGVSQLFSGLGQTIIGVFEGLTAPIRAVIDTIAGMINDVINLIISALTQLGILEGKKTGGAALKKRVTDSAKEAGAFATGGIVPGASFSGDKLFAKVNSGEMILNKEQQENLSAMTSQMGMLKQAIKPSERFMQTVAARKTEGMLGAPQIAKPLGEVSQRFLDTVAKIRPGERPGRGGFRGEGGSIAGGGRPFARLTDALQEGIVRPLGAAMSGRGGVNESGVFKGLADRGSSMGIGLGEASEGFSFGDSRAGRGGVTNNYTYNIQKLVVEAKNVEEFQKELARKNNLSRRGFAIGIA